MAQKVGQLSHINYQPFININNELVNNVDKGN